MAAERAESRVTPWPGGRSRIKGGKEGREWSSRVRVESVVVVDCRVAKMVLLLRDVCEGHGSLVSLGGGLRAALARLGGLNC